jgi:hypothetical protein
LVLLEMGASRGILLAFDDDRSGGSKMVVRRQPLNKGSRIPQFNSRCELSI